MLCSSAKDEGATVMADTAEAAECGNGLHCYRACSRDEFDQDRDLPSSHSLNRTRVFSIVPDTGFDDAYNPVLKDAVYVADPATSRV